RLARLHAALGHHPALAAARRHQAGLAVLDRHHGRLPEHLGLRGHRWVPEVGASRRLRSARKAGAVKSNRTVSRKTLRLFAYNRSVGGGAPRGEAMTPEPESPEIVLIVDDEAPVRNTFRGWLERSRLGCRVLIADDAESALRLADESRIDLA